MVNVNNLELYEKIRGVPKEAQKTITAGRIKGMTDINPMWRIKTLTEQFGICGIGWYYETTKQWIEEVGNERIACVNINLFVKVNGEWSKPIFGTGGSKLSTVEKSGVYVSDECFKMATTDAISVACKNLGMGADVYWNKDKTKYSGNVEEQPQQDQQTEQQAEQQQAELEKAKIPEVKQKALSKRCSDEKVDEGKLTNLYKVKSLAELSEKQFRNINDHWEDVKKVCS